MSAPTAIHTSRLRGIDLMRLGWHGVRAHPARATLSALGIAIGIAAMISVIGLSLSSQAKVQEQLAALGTNMLTVSPESPSAAVRPHCLPTLQSACGASTASNRSVGSPSWKARRHTATPTSTPARRTG
ncbi:ABC transporter permease [Brevibacterium luteolum]|uniref:ABC transporter permease n=1 Tax=Brevibacterium luteolum TaxID=199591 RepID=UPI003B96E83D